MIFDALPILSAGRARGTRALYPAAAAIAAAVFVIDAFTMIDIAVAVLYATVVLLVASAGSRAATANVAWGCVALTLLGFMLSHDGHYSDGSVARCVVSLLAIATTSMLALRNQASNDMLRKQLEMLDLTHDAIIVYDMDDHVTFWNQGAERLYGWTAQQAMGQPLHELTQTKASTMPIDEIRRETVLHGGWHGELERIRNDGATVYISSRCTLWRDDRGKPLAILATSNDITARKQMEAELQRQQDELRATIDAIPGMVWSSSRDGCPDYMNRRWNEYGVELADDIRDIWQSIVHSDDLPAMQAAWREAVATGSALETTARIRRKDGVYRWMHIGAEPLRDANGEIVRWYGVNTDIEEHKQTQQALERSEAFLSDAQRLSCTGSIATRVPECDMWWSDETYRIFDIPRHVTPSIELIAARTHPDDIDIVKRTHERALAGESHIDSEFRLLLTDGSVKHVHYVAHLSAPASGKVEYVGALMDVTDRVTAQEALDRSTAELAHVTRVTMLGEMAASIAHEVTQPLAAIVTAGDAAKRWLNRPRPDLDEVGLSIGNMTRDAKRATDIIRQIRAMAQKRDPSPMTLDLNALAREAIELLRRELEAHAIEVETGNLQHVLRVSVDRVQIQQVVINLMMNAVQAMSAVKNRARRLKIVTHKVDDGHAQLSVEDSGTGISEENSRRLFSPFFTTRKEGMGIGLSICRSIVEAHGGRIWAESQEGEGTTMQFILPLDEVVKVES
ncbi:PAS domain-containing sensor histidine kinase [Paraburkholderia terrae]|uniref:histidine kinase n=1 Tax=Paraburkholderia terrae TaxID=311230 RepID=A0A2I8EXF8_9BURK|nr:PAS domain-containing sensor histidine kinase [Paraburkholderia terrae]AUT64138.1 PAS domain-containing sensor histidine kinase [Paraburkholderia terrae]